MATLLVALLAAVNLAATTQPIADGRVVSYEAISSCQRTKSAIRYYDASCRSSAKRQDYVLNAGSRQQADFDPARNIGVINSHPTQRGNDTIKAATVVSSVWRRDSVTSVTSRLSLVVANVLNIFASPTSDLNFIGNDNEVWYSRTMAGAVIAAVKRNRPSWRSIISTAAEQRNVAHKEALRPFIAELSPPDIQKTYIGFSATTATWVANLTAVFARMKSDAQPIAQGRVVSYSVGIMRIVANNRGMKMLPWVSGYVSTRRCERVDTRADPTLKKRPWLVLARINGGPLRTMQVVDCSAPADLPYHIRSGLILEVDAASGRRDRVDALNNKVAILRIWRP